MNRWLRMPLVAVALVVALVLVSCSSAPAPAAGGAQIPNPIPVALVNIFTGQAVAYGEAIREGGDLAMEEINAKGGILGSKLKFIYEDEASKPEQAVQAFQKVISSDKVVAILGPGYTPSAMATQKVNEEAKIPSILSLPSGATVTAQGSKYLFRTSPNDANLTKQLVEYVVKTLKRDKLGIFAYNNDLGKGGADFITKWVQEAGGKILATELVNLGDKDFAGQVAKFKSLGIQTVFTWTQHPEAALIARQAKDKGWPLQLFGGTLLSSPKLIELGGDAVEGTTFAIPFYAGTVEGKAKAFTDAYKAKYKKEPDNFAAQSYDSVYLLKDAIERAKSVNGTALRDALAATKGFNGVLGSNLNMLPNGDLDIKFLIIQVKNGKWVKA